MLRLSILLFTLLISLAGYGQPEHISNFEVHIEVQTNRSIRVTEKIRVYARGAKIRRGITRDLPLRRDTKGKSTRISYQIQSIKLDGKRAPYFSENQGNQKVLYIGDKDRFLTPNRYYEYTIEYTVRNQVVIFDDYDEIYWNAVGTGVQFPIYEAQATVQIPDGAHIVQEEAYVGRFGAQEKDYSKTIAPSGDRITYKVNRRMAPQEGLTVAVAMPSGTMAEPTFIERLGALVTLGIGIVILFFYYVATWLRHGIDPPIPTPYPQFTAPRDFSPGSINYLHNARLNMRALTASIVHLAIKGYVRIEEKSSGSRWITKGKQYTLHRLRHPGNSLPDEQKRFMEALFRKRKTVDLYGEYNQQVSASKTAHHISLRSQHSRFLREGHNQKYLAIPFLIILLSLGISMGIMHMLSVDPGAQAKYIALSVPVFIITLGVYSYLIRRPTRERQQIKSEIMGFEMYLDVAENERIQKLNPPDMTPELFEELLPYAFALGLEHIWSKRFKDVLEAANYQPTWSNGPVYRGMGFHSALNQGYSTASVKPSSDGSGGGFSGSGGGGFSGGGGGGGGVGGW